MTEQNPVPPDLPEFYAKVLGILEAADPWSGEKLHPSDFGAILPPRADGSPEGCARRTWLRTRGAKGREPALGQVLVLSIGRWTHQLLEELILRFQGHLGGGWVVEDVEASVAEEEGTLDVLLRHSPTGLLAVKDFKTVSAGGFYYLRRDGAAKPAHVLQVRAYMRAHGATWGQVAYVDKAGGGGMWECPPFARDDQAVEAAWEELHRRCGAEAACPPPLLPVLKDRKTLTLPWCCQYTTQGAVAPVVCEYLDTDHCPGALPAAERPALETKWVPVTKAVPR